MSVSDVKPWYDTNAPRFQDLEDKVTNIIKEILQAEKIQFQFESRVKKLDSFKEKILRNGYSDINQVRDLLGLRIICYLYSDIKKISDLIQDNFHVHDIEDKSEKLGIDRVGYQSVHFIVSL